MTETDGWGEDFDDDGNVIGDVPESGTEPNFVERHWKAIAAVAVVWFLLGLPRVTATDVGIGGLIGAAVGSFLIAIPLTYIGVKIRGAL